MERCTKSGFDFETTNLTEGLTDSMGTALNRLSAYEDAEEQGLLVRLPCKVGDKVYFINWTFDSEICPATVIKIEINLFTPEHPLWLRIEYTSKRLGTHEYHATSDSMLNKTVFLTREKAEKALKEAR